MRRPWIGGRRVEQGLVGPALSLVEGLTGLDGALHRIVNLQNDAPDAALAVGGLVLSAGSWSPDRPGAERAPGGVASGAAVMVRLLGESAAPGPAGARADVSLPQVHTRRIQPPPARTADPPKWAEPRRAPAKPAPIVRAASDERPPPRAPRPPAAPLQAEDPAEISSLAAGAVGSGASQTVIGMASPAPGPAGGPLPSGDLGPGGGYETGRVDRVARPVGQVRPHYPARARQRGEEADVVVAVWVGAGGDVDRAAVSSSAGPEFDAAALAAVFPLLRTIDADHPRRVRADD